MNFKHNPYVGTFHSINRNDTISHRQSNVIDTKSPLLPMFRHAPPGCMNNMNTISGLKSLLYEDPDFKSLKPFVTQVQVSEQVKPIKKHLTPDALKHLPLSIFDVSLSPSITSDNDLPTCSICLDCFKDGDELRTLECSHCYHRHCIDIWLIGCLSDELTDTCKCPQCRQAIKSSVDNDIPSSVILRIGQSLSNVDSVSDITSENGSVRDEEYHAVQLESVIELDSAISPVLSISPLTEDFDNIDSADGNENDQPLLGSAYSDCGYPL